MLFIPVGRDVDLEDPVPLALYHDRFALSIDFFHFVGFNCAAGGGGGGGGN